MDDLVAVRARHQPTNTFQLAWAAAPTRLVAGCRQCNQPWPCDAVRLLEQLDAQAARLAAAEQVLGGYEAWEAAVLEDAACWPDGTPAIVALPQEHYDGLLALQEARNTVLAAGVAGEGRDADGS